MKRKVSTTAFFGNHPVFSLDQAAQALGPEGGRARVQHRLKHHLKTGRLKAVARGVYAVVPPGATLGQARPDPVMVAAALWPDAVFSEPLGQS